ncbi:MAG: ABC transporter substrate-binding protein [Rhodospirillaceae bacterium]
MSRLTGAAFAGAVVLAIAGPATAEQSIKIGVLNDLSSVYSDLGGAGSVIAAKLAIEDFDAAAKGLKVEVIGADHQNKPDIGVGIAKQWFETDGVDVIVDVPNSGVALQINQLTKDKNKVFLDSGAGTSDLTGAACTPNTIHWTYDTWALANGTGNAVVATGGTSWFFLTADYKFGQDLERDTSAVVSAKGGKVLGAVRFPLKTPDFSSYLLQAQTSGAKVIGLAMAGGDFSNAIKQAAEFGIVEGGQKLAGMLVFLTDIHALGLQAAQGLQFTGAFYWDMSESTRAFAKRFSALDKGIHPTMVHAGVYSSVLHYLKAVTALGDKNDGAKVVAKMKELPTEDPLFGKGSVRADGRKIHPLYLFEVKKPAESKGPWDYYKIVQTTPAEQAFRPLSQGGCSLVK